MTPKRSSFAKRLAELARLVREATTEAKRREIADELDRIAALNA